MIDEKQPLRWIALHRNSHVQMLLLTIAVTAAAYAGTTVGPLQETMRVALGVDDDQMAILQGPALALPMVLAAVPLGLIVDRYIRVRLVVLFAVCDLLGTVMTAAGSGFGVIVAARGLIGFTSTAVNPVALSLIADLYPAEERGRATMAMAVGQTCGAAIAFALGGALLDRGEPGVQLWRSVMMLLAIPLIPVIFATMAMREPRRTGVIISRPSPGQAFAELWRYRFVIAPLMAGIVLMQIATGALLVWTAPVLERHFAVEPTRVGAIMALVMLVSGFAGPAAGGFIADFCQRHGGPRRTLMALGVTALLSVPAALFAVAPTTAASTSLIVVFTSVIGASCVIGTTLFTIVVPNELRGLCMGIFAAMSVLFSVGAAPMLVSRLSRVMGGPAMIGAALSAVCVATTLIGAATFLWARRYLPRSAAEDPIVAL